MQFGRTVITVLTLAMAPTGAQAAGDEFEIEGAVTSGGGSAESGDLKLDVALGQPVSSEMQRGGEFGLTGGIMPQDADSVLSEQIFSDGFEPEDVL